jgi:hypothetical protein
VEAAADEARPKDALSAEDKEELLEMIRLFEAQNGTT